MEITIKIFNEKGSTLLGAEIYINGEWFKEIGGLTSPQDIIEAISQNEDFLDTINSYNAIN